MSDKLVAEIGAKPRRRLELSQFVHVILPVGECCSLSNTAWEAVKNIARRRKELAKNWYPLLIIACLSSPLA